MSQTRTPHDSRTPLVLAISSQVAVGHVGLSAITPVLQRLRVGVVALPTVLLSNHPGHRRFHGKRVDPELLAGMFDTIETNGWLRDIDAILLGYLPSSEHVAIAADLIKRVRAVRTGMRFTVLCDPVIGDDPKGLYIDESAADAIRRDLVPLADILTPNRFEVSWLSGVEVTDPASALRAARAIGVPNVMVTSVPGGTERLANVLVSASGAFKCDVERRNHMPNGTGDAFAALLLAALLRDGATMREALALATARIDVIAASSAGSSELRLIENAADWVHAPPLPTAVC